MANRKRSLYEVDEDALKRMVAGDTTALEKIQKQEESLPEEVPVDTGIEEPEERAGKAGRKPVALTDRTPSGGRKPTQLDGNDEYRKRFLQVKLTGARRQTYIHDSLYKVCAKILPVIAPDMSVPTFVNSVLSDHLNRYKNEINAIYSEEASKEAIE